MTLKSLKKIFSKDESLTDSQEEILENKLIWILGSARSGTTWLGRDLLRHPNNILWDEPKIIQNIGQVKLSKSDNNREFTTNPKSFFSPMYKNVWSVHLRKLILARLFAHSQTLEKNVIIKEPIGVHDPDIVLQCLPKSKFIFLVRDGRDIVDSKIDTHFSNSWLRNKERTPRELKSQETKNKTILFYSKTWNTNMIEIKKTFDKHDPQLRTIVKYEDLLKKPFITLKKVYDFIGLSIERDELNKIIEASSFERIPESRKGPGKFYRSASPGNWKKNFSTSEQELMNSIMGKILQKFGYTVD